MFLGFSLSRSRRCKKAVSFLFFFFLSIWLVGLRSWKFGVLIGEGWRISLVDVGLGRGGPFLCFFFLFCFFKLRSRTVQILKGESLSLFLIRTHARIVCCSQPLSGW